MRRLRRILVWIIGITIFLGAFSYWQGQRLLNQLGITNLHWALGELGFTRVHLARLSFTTHQNDVVLVVAADDLRLQWRWDGFTPHVTSATLNNALVVVNHKPKSVPDEPTEFSLPHDWRLPEALPEDVFIERLEADLPCATGRCVIASQVRGQWLQDIFSLQLQTRNTPDTVNLDITYTSSADQPALRFAVVAPNLIQFNGATRLSANENWSGDLHLNLQPPAKVWVDYLQGWYAFDSALAHAFDQPSRVSAQWSLALPSLLLTPESITEERDLTAALTAISARLKGELKLMLDLPAPVPIPGLGSLSGQARVDLAAEARSFTDYLLDVDLHLEPVVLHELFAGYDVNFDSLQLTLDSRSEESVNLQALPLQVHIVGAGNVQFSGTANLQLNSETLALTIREGEVEITAAEWSPVAAVKLANINLKQKFTAQWQPNVMSYSLLEAGELQADITGADFAIKGAKINLHELAFTGEPASWLDGELHSKASVSVARLEQAQLHPQPWSWQGEIKAGAHQARIQGKLTVNNSLVVDHTLRANENRWQLEWQLPDIFLLAGNSLQLLTPHWPPLLTLQRGRLSGEGEFSANWGDENPIAGATSPGTTNASPITGKASVRLVEVAGIYDTTAFVGVSGDVNVLLAADSFSVASDNLTANEIVQGFTFGPARAAFAYSAALANPAKGKLRMNSLQSALLGGSVEIPTTTLDFSLPTEQTLQIDITELDLAQLLAEHPSSDLTGSGIISGRVPVTISAAGFSVNGGQLAARPPGGQLQYRSARAADLAASAQGMKIITDALDDFHYTLLSSEVSYDASGKLLLGVRLEGKNPALEDGRPINFNINLEEDLPAMIYSLQLTNQLNEIIKKRVQEKMRRKPAP